MKACFHSNTDGKYANCASEKGLESTKYEEVMHTIYRKSG